MRKKNHRQAEEHGQSSESTAGARAHRGDVDEGQKSPTESASEEIEAAGGAENLIDQLRAERDEAVEGRLRALADFRNYQRRAIENEQRAHQRGAINVVHSIFPALDHFDLALNQKPENLTAEQLLGAVRIVRDEFMKSLQTQGVERIEPGKGDPFDPTRHQAVMKQVEEGAEPNTIISLLQSGYAMGEVVLRPAKVVVAGAPDEEG